MILLMMKLTKTYFTCQVIWVIRSSAWHSHDFCPDRGFLSPLRMLPKIGGEQECLLMLIYLSPDSFSSNPFSRLDFSM